MYCSLPLVHACMLSLQSCPTLCDPMDYSLPGSSVHGILQARILEWVAMPSSRGSSLPRDWTCVSSTSCIGRCFFFFFFLTTSTTWEASRVKMDPSQEAQPKDLSLSLLSWGLIIVNYMLYVNEVGHCLSKDSFFDFNTIFILLNL